MEEKKESLSSQEILKIDRYLWIARAFSAVAILAFVANVLLFSAIGSLYPLVRIQPFYLNVLDKNQQVIDIRPVDAFELQSPEVIEALVRQYVLARYEAMSDVQEVQDRWGPDGIIASMSAQSVYDDFVETNDQNNLLDDIIKEGMTIEASIRSAGPKPNTENTEWTVEVDLTYGTMDSVDHETVRLEIDLSIRFDPLFEDTYQTTWQHRLRNPLGFRVTSYGETKK